MRAFTVWLLTGADVSRGTLPVLARAFARGKLRLVVVAVRIGFPKADLPVPRGQVLLAPQLEKVCCIA